MAKSGWWERLTEEQREQYRARNKQWRDSHPDQRRASDARRRTRKNEWAKERARLDPEGTRRQVHKHRIKTTYSITIEEYDRMFSEQGGVCAACGEPERVMQNGRIVTLSVDHDHSCCPGRKSCGKCVRRLLCARCNNTLGRSGESPDVLRKIADYVDGALGGIRTRESGC